MTTETDFCALLDGGDDLTALCFADHSSPPISRRQLRDGAVTAAHWLAEHGFSRGDALALWLPNGAAWAQLLFAAARLGVLIVPISTRYKANEARHLLEVSRAKGIVAPREFLDIGYAAIVRELRGGLPSLLHVFEIDRPLDVLEQVAPDLMAAAKPSPAAASPDDLLCCFSTSGTTGLPKLAAHRRAGLMRHANVIAQRLELGAGDALLSALPFFGVFGFVTMLASLAARARLVLLPLFEPVAAAAAIEREAITHMIGADAMFATMLALPDRSWGSWRRAVQADFSGLTSPVTERGDHLGIRFSGTYGSSECLALMALHPWQADCTQRAKSGGTPMEPAIEVRIAALESDALETGTQGGAGEIQIRGPNVMAGYLNNAHATAKAFTQDGWYRSGDLGQQDGQGFVYLGRLGVSAMKFCSSTSQPLWARAIAASSGEPSSPVGRWPRALNATKSRPGPQPKSRIVNGAGISIACSSASTFWLTS
jgi:acyl-CoA synthetase (AMP-forming)/AMP-acid ligase II